MEDFELQYRKGFTLRSKRAAHKNHVSPTILYGKRYPLMRKELSSNAERGHLQEPCKSKNKEVSSKAKRGCLQEPCKANNPVWKKFSIRPKRAA